MGNIIILKNMRNKLTRKRSRRTAKKMKSFAINFYNYNKQLYKIDVKYIRDFGPKLLLIKKFFCILFYFLFAKISHSLREHFI